jgi:biopolymer transport protein ExbD
MIDVVFQLIIFFMCAMKFKTLAMKIDMNIPKTKGSAPTVLPLVEKEPIRVVLEQTDAEGVPHVSLFGEEIRPDLGRGVGPLPRIPLSGDHGEIDAAKARHETVWREHYVPKLAVLRDRLESYREADPTLEYQVAAGPRVRHAFMVGVLDTFLEVGIEQVDIRGTEGPAPGR